MVGLEARGSGDRWGKGRRKGSGRGNVCDKLLCMFGRTICLFCTIITAQHGVFRTSKRWQQQCWPHFTSGPPQ